VIGRKVERGVAASSADSPADKAATFNDLSLIDALRLETQRAVAIAVVAL